ncbi:Aste57867_3131 [Aphanomyces stellatus]|uniref:Aste57867_3131 protein n=1 Tax=Aphanomyces stellatus TaxID=120398 RepID=A0A485KDC6_9STRA|nr:hypothetical protein As57867_003122 [Aphanomyces stellatus]VFT80307.1 Aste57867_3131 [Aphanomyces stellatus]
MQRATTNHDLPNDQRWSLYHDLLENKRNGRLARGKAAELLQKYGISRQTLSKVRKRGQHSRAVFGRADVAAMKKGRSGRPPKRTVDDVEAAVKSVPPHLRKTFVMLAASSGIPSTTLWRVLQTKKLQRRTSRLKPMVTDKHKADRVEFVQAFVRPSTNGQMRWDDMLDRVHIDEKWFYLTLVNRRYYLWHDEDVPVRKCSSKRHIIKVMFLTAVARPRYDYTQRRMWDGKIGMWPFVSVVPAQRKSKNRERGTPVTTPVTVTKKVYREYLLEHVIPTIKKVWPGRRSHPIYIQQDNARPHVEVDDAAVTLAGHSDGWSIQLVAQPAMSPDFNVLDLGFFNSIQALQHREVVTGIDDLVAAVHRAFDDLDWSVLDKTFMTLQRVMGEALKMGGDNAFKLPHSKKDKTARLGPVARVVCDPDTKRSSVKMYLGDKLVCLKMEILLVEKSRTT